MRDSVLEHEQEALERCFASLDGVVLAYVFESHARYETWVHSDVDVAVLLEGLPDDDHCFDMRLQVVGGVMDVLQTDAVDALILNQAPPALAHAVLRDGILIFCRDERTRIDFYLRTVNRYLDFKPVLSPTTALVILRSAATKNLADAGQKQPTGGCLGPST